MSAIRPPETTQHLEYMQRMVRREIPGPPIAELVGFDITHIDLGHSIAEMDASRRHANPMGTLHGGIVCDLADVEDEKGSLVAKVWSSCMVLRGSEAQGR
jgi:hypothetical protein